MVIGGYAVGAHGWPRATKDLDVWVEASTANAPRIIGALRTFGAPLHDLREDDLHTPGTGFKIGIEPGRVDVLTKIAGIDFADAWPNCLLVPFAPDVVCRVIGLADLMKNKRAAGRPQDLADVDHLERQAAARARRQ